MEGLAFFLTLLPNKAISFSLVSRENEEEESVVREKLKGMQWLITDQCLAEVQALGHGGLGKSVSSATVISSLYF